jgi:hypothetical protein
MSGTGNATGGLVTMGGCSTLTSAGEGNLCNPTITCTTDGQDILTVSATTDCDDGSLLAASGTGNATGALVGASGTGSGIGVLLGASGTGNAYSPLISASLTGDANCSGPNCIAVSGTGHATGATHESACDLLGGTACLQP